MTTKSPRSKSSKSKPVPPTESSTKSLEALERALKTLYKGDYEKAREQFVRVEKDFPGEAEILDSVRAYVSICDQRLAPQKRMKDAEEYVNAGILELNEGNTQQALKLFTKAADLDSKSAHIQYCLAAAHAAAGDATTAATHLELAIAGDPSTRIHARTDVDFASVRDSAEVVALLGA